jgi:hypothetical protein
MTIARHLELALLVIALPIFIAAGWPLAGWFAGGGAWLLQKGIGIYTTQRATEATEPRRFMAWMAGSMVGRGWLVALTILAVGLADQDAGLAAAVLFLALFTVYFTVQMILRPFQQTPRNGTAGPTPGSAA